MVVASVPAISRCTHCAPNGWQCEEARMSASGYKQTFGGGSGYVRFTPESGHSDAQERVGLEKRTLDVRLAPESGPNSTLR